MLNLDEYRKKSKEPYHIVKSKDGTELFIREWRPDISSNTAFVIFHGITAHSEPYSVIGQSIANMGFTTYGIDLRGHGLSGGTRGDYKNSSQFYEDMDTIMTFLKNRHEKIVLIGHSLGVVTSVMVANKFPDQINGLILLSAARKIRDDAYPKRSIFTTLKYLFWSTVKPSKPVIHYYREGIRGQDDPLFNFYYTLRFLKTISANNFQWPNTINYPVFYGLGDQDELFAIEAGKEMFQEIPSPNKTMDIMKETGHANFNENSFDNLYKWISLNFQDI